MISGAPGPGAVCPCASAIVSRYSATELAGSPPYPYPDGTAPRQRLAASAPFAAAEVGSVEAAAPSKVPGRAAAAPAVRDARAKSRRLTFLRMLVSFVRVRILRQMPLGIPRPPRRNNRISGQNGAPGMTSE